MSILLFLASMCFRLWAKIYTKRCANNSLISRDKPIFLLLNLNDHMLSIWELFGNTLVAFDFDEKFTQNVARILCNITCRRSFFAYILRLITCFQFQRFGKRKNTISAKILNQKYGGKNSNSGFVPRLFTLLTFSYLYCSY